MVETFSTPQTQKLLGALLEERILNALPKNGNNGANTTKIKGKGTCALEIVFFL